MPHPLAEEYGLTPDELLDAINRRFRAKVTLEGLSPKSTWENT